MKQVLEENLKLNFISCPVQYSFGRSAGGKEYEAMWKSGWDPVITLLWACNRSWLRSSSWNRKSPWSLPCVKPWYQLGAHLRAVTLSKGSESCREQLWWRRNEAAWSSLWGCLMSVWIAQMVHPFRFHFCQLLLQWCSAALSVFQVLSQLLGLMQQLRTDVAFQGAPFTPGSFSLGLYTEFFCYTNVSWGKLQCLLQLDVCGVGNLERTPCEHQGGTGRNVVVALCAHPELSVLTSLADEFLQIPWSRESGNILWVEIGMKESSFQTCPASANSIMDTEYVYQQIPPRVSSTVFLVNFNGVWSAFYFFLLPNASLRGT